MQRLDAEIFLSSLAYFIPRSNGGRRRVLSTPTRILIVGHRECSQAYSCDWERKWDSFKAIPDEVFDAGETVVSCGHYTGKYLATETEVRAQFAHVFKFREGKIVRFQQYTDTAQFQKAVSA
jgi:ketosteroid isomerase-like protein